MACHKSLTELIKIIGTPLDLRLKHAAYEIFLGLRTSFTTAPKKQATIIDNAIYVPYWEILQSDDLIEVIRKFSEIDVK